MPATIYISSTYQDLKEHRAAVRTFFYKFPQTFTTISMENYVAEDIRPAEKCMQDVRNCKFYILIIANRYGFIPETVEGKPNTEKFSVTELEFNEAVKSGAKILAFVGDETDDLKCDTDEDKALLKIKQDNLKAFKKKVLDGRMSHPDRFRSAQDLTIQVQESFFKAQQEYPELFTAETPPIDIKVNEDRIYCCNREIQFNEYLAVNSKSCFKAWLIFGQEDDMVESFTTRISKLTLGINIPYEASLNTIFGSGSSYEACKSIFLNAVYKQLFDKLTDEESVTVERFITDISNHTVRGNNENEKSPARVAFIINCTSVPSQKDIRFTYLQQFLFDFYEACNKQQCANICFFINIEFLPENENDFKSIIDTLKKSKEAGNYFFPLSRLGKAEKGDIDLWIKKYLTDVPFKVNKIKNTFFKDLPSEFQMSEAEEDLYQFVKKINKKDAQLLEILL